MRDNGDLGQRSSNEGGWLYFEGMAPQDLMTDWMWGVRETEGSKKFFKVSA